MIALRTLGLMASVGAFALGVLASDAIRARPRTIAEFLESDDARIAEGRLANEQRAVALATARCMVAHGLTYHVPTDPLLPSPTENLSPIDFAERYGFGLVSGGHSYSVDDPDPNHQMLLGLDVEERRTYVAALYGNPASGQVGCSDEAYEEVYGARDALWAALQDPLAALARSWRSDRRVAKVEETWRWCMDEHGWELSSRLDLEQLVQERFPRLIADASLLPPAERDDTLERIGEAERSLAVAVVQCDDVTMATISAIRAEYEGAFILTHLSELGRLREELRRFDPSE